MKYTTLSIWACLLTATAAADVLHLKNGGTVHGTVIQETDDAVTIAMQYGTMTKKRADIESIEKTAAETPPTKTNHTGDEKADAALPDWSALIRVLAAKPWATGLAQIPATVINKGVMRNVPYTSYRCGAGGDYEFNIYGDPDTPAGVEIGVYGRLLDDRAAKQQCVDFIASILPNEADAAMLKGVPLENNRLKIEHSHTTMEITPTTAEDAYGGWWVSVYFEQNLDEARASEDELSTITGEKDAAVATTTPPPVKPRPRTTPSTETVPGWTNPELQRARPSQNSANSSSTTGRVYVRGYYRKNGTYVRGYYRRR